MKRKIWLYIILALMAALIALPVIAHADDGKIKTVDLSKPKYSNMQLSTTNTAILTKQIPTITFGGQTSYATLTAVMQTNGDIVCSFMGNSYTIKGQVGSQTFASNSAASRKIGNKWLDFDNTAYNNKIQVEIRGQSSTATEDLQFESTKESRRVGNIIWFGNFDNNGNPINAVGFDFSDAVQQATYDKNNKKLSFNVGAGKQYLIDPSVVGTTTIPNYVGDAGNVRNSFYVNGRHWVFYGDGTNFVFRTSTDGASWSAATTAHAGLSGQFSIYFDGVYVYYAINGGSNTYFRRGVPGSDGTITWSAAEQTVYSGTSYWASVVADSDGYPFVIYMKGSDNEGYLDKSSTNDGTWSSAAGFPIFISAGTTTNYYSMLNLGSNEIYITFRTNVWPGGFYGKLWNGTALGGAETIAASAYLYSITNYEDNVVAVYLTQPAADNLINIKERTGGAWGAASTVYNTGGSGVYPSVTSLNDSGDLIVFWSLLTTDHVYYIKRESGSWDGSATDWIDESGDTIPLYNIITFMSVYSGVVGAVYPSKAANPYDVNYAFLSLLSAPSITTNAATNVTLDTARLNAYVSSDGGEACEVRVGWGESDESDNITAYDHYTDWFGSYTTGEHPYYDVDSLNDDTTYYFNWEIQNSEDSDTGSSTSFITEATSNEPTNLSASATSSTEMSATWTKGVGSTYTLVRAKVGEYPTDTTDGIEVYEGAESTASYDGFNAGDNVFVRAWGWTAADGYTVDYAEDMVTMPLSNETTSSFSFDVSTPARLFTAPNYENMANNPLYAPINSFADAFGVPRGTWWFGMVIFASVAFGIFILVYSKSLFGAMAAVLLILGWGWAMELVPFVIIILYLVIGGSIGGTQMLKGGG